MLLSGCFWPPGTGERPSPFLGLHLFVNHALFGDHRLKLATEAKLARIDGQVDMGRGFRGHADLHLIQHSAVFPEGVADILDIIFDSPSSSGRILRSWNQ